jgi:hypothetical protein
MAKRRRVDTEMTREATRELWKVFGKCLPTPVMPKSGKRKSGKRKLEGQPEDKPEEKWETSFFADLDSEFLIIDGRVLNVLDVGLKERLLYEKERRRWSDDFKKLSDNSPSVFEYLASIN